MPQYGTQLENIFKAYDRQLEQMRREARVGGYFEELWQSKESQDLVRELNQFGIREEQYQSLLQTGSGSVSLSSPLMVLPNFRTSPLRVFHAYLTTPTTVTNNTLTVVTFETSRGDTSVFDFYNNDKSKIILKETELNVRIDGVLDWDANADGYRSVFVSVHNEAGTQLGAKEISLVEAVEQASIPTRMNFGYTEDIKGLFPDCAYFSMYIKHEAGANLNLLSFVLSVSIA